MDRRSVGRAGGDVGGSAIGVLVYTTFGPDYADADAKAPTDLYVFSRARFVDRAGDDPELAQLLFSRLARAIAHRLRQTDAELRALEDR